MLLLSSSGPLLTPHFLCVSEKGDIWSQPNWSRLLISTTDFVAFLVHVALTVNGVSSKAEGHLWGGTTMPRIT